jgi:S-sulfo-L-cysteine synthase (O-acetyl-L-serine-dependent)
MQKTAKKSQSLNWIDATQKTPPHAGFFFAYNSLMNIFNIEQCIGNTPLVRLNQLPAAFGISPKVSLLGKMEGNNPAGSVKDRAALYMLKGAEERGEIKRGDTIIEATSGNTGIALAMVAALRGYKMILIMPDDLSLERRQSMTAYGAQLILTPAAQGGMEYARDLAMQMQSEGKGRVLDQFSNADCPRAHFETTGPEIWRDTSGQVTHFVSAMGTTGTIIGTSRYLKSQNQAVQIVGCRPTDGSKIPGIRKWPEAYLPKIFDASCVDQIEEVSQADAEDMARRLAVEEGIFGGISAAGAACVALRVAQQLDSGVIVFIVCDRGDRYLSTGVFA